MTHVPIAAPTAPLAQAARLIEPLFRHGASQLNDALRRELLRVGFGAAMHEVIGRLDHRGVHS